MEGDNPETTAKDMQPNSEIGENQIESEVGLIRAPMEQGLDEANIPSDNSVETRLDEESLDTAPNVEEPLSMNSKDTLFPKNNILTQDAAIQADVTETPANPKKTANPVEAIGGLASKNTSSLSTIQTVEKELDFKPIKRELEFLKGSNSRTIRDIWAENYKLFHSFGFLSHKRANLQFLDEQTVLSSIGNLLVIYDLKTGGVKYIKGVRDGSINSIAVHPSKKFIAVGELAHSDPNIYVYAYPSMQIYKILKGGADRGYADLCFNQLGNKLASVACDPDYMLTVWSWKDSAILLRSKAFSQDVYRVSFSPDNDGILTSSGMGHIKFWRMSATFTGLKLQGYIGKFGASELTDIASFVQLPDGKVLSSTETGNLLLWDGGMIKCEIGVKGKKPCHLGKIEVILLGEGEIITGGEDGFFRIWDLETIDNADVQSNGAEGSSSVSVPRVFEMEVIDEILVAKDVKIKNIVRYLSGAEYLIQDQQGHLLKLDLNKRTVEKILSFHSGSVVAIAYSPVYHQMATLGCMGNLRLYDYLQKNMIAKTSYPQGGACMSYVPTCIDSSGCTLVLGFNDGVVRFVSTIASSFHLHFALKPHKQAIISVTFNSDGSKMVTASEDGTLFIFSIQIKKNPSGIVQPFTKSNVNIVPQGFLSFESPVNHVSFAEDQDQNQFTKKKTVPASKLFITLRTGSLYTARVPNEYEYETSTTFEIAHTVLKVTKWNLDIPVRESHHETVEKQESEKVEGEVQKAISKSNLKASQLLSNSLNTLRKLKGLVINSDSPIVATLGLKDDYILMAIVNNENECEIRLANTQKPKFSSLVAVLNEIVSVIQFDQLKHHLLVGTVKGSTKIIRFQFSRFLQMISPIIESHEHFGDMSIRLQNYSIKVADELEKANPQFKNDGLTELILDGQQWTDHLHDISVKVTNIGSSFDNSCFGTSGNDGGIFIWRNLSYDIEQRNVYDSSLDEQLNSIAQSEDISDSATYSLQEAKLKSGRDREVEAAEAKKQILRSQIQDIRKEFMEIVAENNSAPSNIRLNRADLKVDPYLHEDITKDSKLKKEILLKELAWGTEKEAIAPAKLHAKFLAQIKTERVELHAFKTKASVETFRTLNFERTNDPILNSIFAKNDLNTTTNHFLGEEKDSIVQNISSKTPGGHAVKKESKHINNATKLEARKQLRAERAAAWKQLMDSKPDDKYEDPKDVAAIKYAISNMGDYKLKTASDYIVPENERVDADKKKRQIALLNDSIRTLKENFNSKVLTMRDKKVNREISQINKELSSLNESIEELPKIPALENNLFPEKRNVISADDIEEFQKQELVNAENKRGNDEMGFGTGTAATTSTPKDSLIETQEPLVEQTITATTSKSKKPTSAKAGDVESSMRKLELKYQKNRLVNSLEDSISRFDRTVDLLAKERLLLAGDLKYADIKLQLLFKEWMLLKEFEQTDNALADKLNAKKVEKKEVEMKILEFREKLAIKKVEIDGIISQEKAIIEEYRQIVGENNKNEEYINKVFKRKIKRVKKKVKTGDDEDEDSEEEDEDDDESYKSDEDEEEFIEAIPPDCNTNVWQKVLELRDRRLDVEEVLQEIQKSVEIIKKENDSFIKKERIIDASLKNTEVEIQDFQTQKQKKLNELDVIVPLRLHQVQYLNENSIATDLKDALVFYNQGLLQLKRRLRELQQEKMDIKKQHRELKKQHVMYNKSKKEKQARVAELSAKARDVQMLKFGQIVDLEKLEKLGSNKTAEEVKEKNHKEEVKRSKQIMEMKKKIKDKKTELMDVVKENTICLEQIVLLQQQKQNLEMSLNQSQASTNTEISGPKESDHEEREKLIHLVQSQAKQIDEIKAEIENLIRKPTSRTYTYENKQPSQPKNATMPAIQEDETVFRSKGEIIEAGGE